MQLHFSLVQRSSAKILSSDVTLHIQVTITRSFLSGLIIQSSLSGQISLTYSIILHTHAKFNLSFAPKDKHLLANKRH